MKNSVLTRLAALGPRHPETAERAASWIMCGGGVVTALFAFLSPPSGVPSWVPFLPAVAFGLIGATMRRYPPAVRTCLCVAAPLLAVLCITGLDLITGDDSAAGQAFFVLPVLMAASQLRIGGAVLTTLWSIAGSATVSFSLQPWHAGITEVTYVSVALGLTSIVLVRSIAVQYRLIARLQDQAAIDPLTGLVTRRVLDEAAEAAIGRQSSAPGTALILVDVDAFKAINDEFGHPVGDDALVHVGRTLRSLARDGDIVARLGGDELAVLLPDCTNDTAVRRAELLVRTVAATPLVTGGHAVTLSVSAGVAHLDSGEAGIRGLYEIADRALYEAKRTGRGRAVSRPSGEVGDRVGSAR